MGSNGGNTLGMTLQSRPVPVLITRPGGQGDRFLTALRERFGGAVLPVLSPLLTPVFLSPDWPAGPYSSLILTSETGVEAAARLRDAGRLLPVRAICVGDRTAQVARERGFDAVSAKGDAETLVAMVLAGGDEGPFLHLRGREARGDIAPRLTASGRVTRAAVVYAQEPVPLSAEARDLLDRTGVVLAPLFSPRTGDLFAAQGPYRASLRIAAISPATAATVAPLNPQRIAVATRPDAEAMLDAVATLLSDPCA